MPCSETRASRSWSRGPTRHRGRTGWFDTRCARPDDASLPREWRSQPSADPIGRQTIEIFKASPRDLPALGALFERIEQEEGSARSGSATQGLRRSLECFDPFASESAWLHCARGEQGLVGYALAVRVPKLDARVGYLFVDELHVLRDHRRLGVASALIEAVWSLALEIGYHGVRLLVRPENTGARRLYARLGFTEQETGFCERARAR
jgi:ribosomal protein S18 acetylase RimI-like enzyme